MKQGLVEQGMDTEQENIHLEGPDPTLHPYRPHMTLAIRVHPSAPISLGSGRGALQPNTTNAI